MVAALAVVGCAETPPPVAATAQPTTSAPADAGGTTSSRFQDPALEACKERIDSSLSLSIADSPGPYDVAISFGRADALGRIEQRKVTRDQIRELCQDKDVKRIQQNAPMPPPGGPSNEHHGH